VSGFVLYGRVSAGFNRAWMATRPGLALGAGALAAIVALLIGIVVNGRVGVQLAKLRQRLATAGATAPPADAARVAALELRLERSSFVTATLLVFAAAAMAVARYL
jgi:hypothetical protein